MSNIPANPQNLAVVMARPLAAMYQAMPRLHKELPETPVFGMNDAELTVGDLRAADVIVNRDRMVYVAMRQANAHLLNFLAQHIFTPRPMESAPNTGIFRLFVESQDGARRVFAAEASFDSKNDGARHWMITAGWTGWTRLHSGWNPIGWLPMLSDPAPWALAKAVLDARSHIGPRRPDDPDDARQWDLLTEVASRLSCAHNPLDSRSV